MLGEYLKAWMPPDIAGGCQLPQAWGVTGARRRFRTVSWSPTHEIKHMMQQLQRHPVPDHLLMSLAPGWMGEHALILAPAREQQGMHTALRPVGDVAATHVGRVSGAQYRRDALVGHSSRRGGTRPGRLSVYLHHELRGDRPLH